MTDAQMILIVAAIPGTIAAIGAMVVSIITARKVQAASAKIEEVREIVDGPLSVALKSNAELTATVMQLRGDHGDVKAAMEAKAVQENREAGKAEAMKSDSVKLDVVKQAVKDTVEAAVKADTVVQSVAKTVGETKTKDPK